MPQFAPIHTALLDAFFDPTLSVRAIADKFNLRLDQLVVWVRLPRTRADIEGYCEFLKLRTRALSAAATPAAIDALQHANADIKRVSLDQHADLHEHCRLADTVRKTAAALLRAAAIAPNPRPPAGEPRARLPHGASGPRRATPTPHQPAPAGRKSAPSRARNPEPVAPRFAAPDSPLRHDDAPVPPPSPPSERPPPSGILSP